MKKTATIIMCAVLSLSIGIAAASPLLISELNITPFPRIPQGPKANFEINIAYADFNVKEHASNYVSGGEHLSIVDYQVVLNITNHSEFPAKIGNIMFTAAQDVSTIPSIAGGGMSASAGGGQSGGGCSGFVEGVWLDGQWLNVTWLPDGKWPIFPADPFLNITKSIPDLPENATKTGEWIEGVHVWEEHSKSATTITTTSYIFVNGTWVDVTGRVRVDNEQPYVIATNTLLQETLTFDSENYGSYANKTELDEAMAPNNYTLPILSVIKDVWAGAGGFDTYWQPHESRLITLTSTVYVGGNTGLESLNEGKITLYASASSFLKDREEARTTFENTFAVVTDLKEVQVQKNGNNYLYNTILGDNTSFQTDKFGVEVFIKSRS